VKAKFVNCRQPVFIIVTIATSTSQKYHPVIRYHNKLVIFKSSFTFTPLNEFCGFSERFRAIKQKNYYC